MFSARTDHENAQVLLSACAGVDDSGHYAAKQLFAGLQGEEGGAPHPLHVACVRGPLRRRNGEALKCVPLSPFYK